MTAAAPDPREDIDCTRCEGTGSEPDDSADERTYPCQRCDGTGSAAVPGPPFRDQLAGWLAVRAWKSAAREQRRAQAEDRHRQESA